jgi:hypothetical protein
MVLLAPQKRAITNYYIIKPYLQQKTFLTLTQLFGETASRIVKTTGENVIKADWLTIDNYVDILEMFHP